MVALALAQFTRQRDGREAALHKAGVQPPNALARGAEYHRAARLEKAQNVDDGMLYVAGRDADCAVFDIAMRLVAADGGDPQRILLEPFGKRDDRLREGGRKQQRAPFRRGGVENLFQIVPKPKVQHRSEEHTSELPPIMR